MGPVRDNYSDMSAQYRPDRRLDDNNSDMSESFAHRGEAGQGGASRDGDRTDADGGRTDADGGRTDADGGQAASRTTRSRVVVRLPVAVPT